MGLAACPEVQIWDSPYKFFSQEAAVDDALAAAPSLL